VVCDPHRRRRAAGGRLLPNISNTAAQPRITVVIFGTNSVVLTNWTVDSADLARNGGLLEPFQPPVRNPFGTPAGFNRWQVGEATAIGNGLNGCRGQFELAVAQRTFSGAAANASSRALLLLSDGPNNSGVDSIAAASSLKAALPVHIVVGGITDPAPQAAQRREKRAAAAPLTPAFARLECALITSFQGWRRAHRTTHHRGDGDRAAVRDAAGHCAEPAGARADDGGPAAGRAGDPRALYREALRQPPAQGAAPLAPARRSLWWTVWSARR
jgi:hypothetical protein